MVEYEHTWESLDAHPVPDWYADAKLGIFIHWGVYSVPAWAPPEEHYAEWYPYYMYEDGSECQQYHEEEYGSEAEYADFISDWEAENWDPEAWAELFADVGARYVVLTGEHHDGFPLWDSHYTRYNAAEMGPERDIVADLSEAVRARDLRFAASYHANLNYYQPGFEGRFGHPDFEGTEVDDSRPGSEYVDFMNAKHRELIRKYDPDLLWFDVPRADGEHLHAQELVADYYERAAENGREVAVNDRMAEETWSEHGDFYTPEYESFDEITEHKWEACRGIGTSFGYNRAEGPEEHMDARELIHLFVDVVSKNGNLLINVGPKADGTIPDLQREPLEALGEWLDVNGEAIFGTTYWASAEDRDDESGAEVRYTWKDGALYATALDWPGDRFDIGVPEYVDVGSGVEAALLTDDGDVDCEWDVDGDRLRVDLPERPDRDHAFAIRLDGVGNPRV